MNTRSKKIVALAIADHAINYNYHENKEINKYNLDIPSYETTKGTSMEERQLLLKHYDEISIEKEAMAEDKKFHRGKEIMENTTKQNFSEEKNNLVEEWLFDVNECLHNSDIISEKNDVSEIQVQADSGTKTFSDFSESPSEYQPSSSCILDTESDEVEKLSNQKTLLETTHSGYKSLSPQILKLSDVNEMYDSISKFKEKIPVKSKSQKIVRTYSKNEVETNCNKKVSEESCTEVTDESGSERILVRNASKHKNTGKRIRNKGHCCLLYDKILINIARHYELMHKNEIQVAKILVMPKGSKKRREGFEELTRTADFYHNCQVIDQKEGELILVRRPSSKEKSNLNYSSYGPCPQCLGFMIKKRLWHHIKYNCKSSKVRNVVEKAKRKVIDESNALLIGLTHNEFSLRYQETILSKFRDDEISAIIKNDLTILKFGYLQYEKYGISQCELIRQTMRQLGRLLLQVQSINPQIKNLSDCLLPKHFDLVLTATKSLCRTCSSNERPHFEIPSLALKLGHALKKCVSIHRGIDLRKGDLKKKETHLAFLNLMEMEWSSKISSCALSTLHKRKFNHKELLPLTEDLVHLMKYLNQEILKLKEICSNSIDYKSWRNLASCTLARIILFNKKRSGEASKMTIEQYATRPTFKEQGTQELLTSLSPLEKYLASTMEVVDIEGKRGSRVPVIITKDLKSAIDLLIKTRSTVGVTKNNPYIFAPAASEVGHLRGHDCLRYVCNDANLKHPEFITGTKLRKYVATVCQIFNLGENEADWIARHLGHDIRVHRNFYRLHENAVETTKISRLLIAVEQGDVNKYAGKSLEEINIEDLPGLEEESCEVEKSTVSDEMSSSDDEIPLAVRTKQQGKNQIMKKKKKEIREKKAEESSLLIVDKNTQKKKITSKQPWSTEEIKCVLNFFKSDIKKLLLPGKEKCLACINKYSELKTRKWTDIKFYVKNYYQRNRRLTQKNNL